MRLSHHPDAGPSPLAWLWQEIERRLGKDTTKEIRVEWLQRWREYNGMRWGRKS